MRTRVFCLTSLLLLFAAVTHADDWNKSYDVPGTPELRLVTSDANVRVSAGTGNKIEAHLTTSDYKIGAGGISVYEHQTGNAVTIELHYPHMNWNFGWSNHHRVEMEVTVPANTKLDLQGSDGRVAISGVKGPIIARTSDGSLDIDGVDGSLDARTSDGKMRVSGRFDHLDLQSSDGGISATALPGSKVERGWSLHASDGRVELRIPENLNANMMLHTSDGHIDLDVPLAVSGRLGTHDIQGKLNGGGELLEVRTSDGSIRVGRS
jgi:DUF4097 and DUF4098 domain-containing protein YvlB